MLQNISKKRMSKILDGISGVLCLIDDVLVYGKNREEHNARLEEVLERLKEARVTLNPEKCVFCKSKLTFLGHLIDENDIQADPEKTTAIVRMKAPTHVTELRRFLGMANQLGKFSPNLANLTQLLRELLSKNNSWYWSSHHDQAFDQVKMELTRPTVLTMYDLEAEKKVSADASSFGLGAVLLQRHEGEGMWKPIAYGSRSMTETEGRYAQIEKEALAVT